MSIPREIRRHFEALVAVDASERADRLAALEPEVREAVVALLAAHDADPGSTDAHDPESTVDLPFDVLAGVRLGAELGAGGSGSVYRGVDEETGETVAIKMLFLGLLGNASSRARFEREAETMARFDHPSIVRVRRAGLDRGTPYIVMDYVGGSNLARELNPHTRQGIGPGRDDPRGVARFVGELASALAYAHGQGVIHRDVKPANVLIDDGGNPKLTDFGLARDEFFTQTLTRTGAMTGTFGYMSPEQLLGDRPMDARTDVYSLGVVLYEMLSGERPHAGGSSIELARAMSDTLPRPLGKLNDAVPRNLQTICMRALEREPSRRYDTMAAFAADLHAFASGHPIQAKAPSTISRVRGVLQRRRRMVAIAGSMVAIGVAGLWGGSALREPEGTPVELVSDVPGTRVWMRPFDVATRDFGAAIELGEAGRRHWLEPGLVRFVFTDPEGRFAELSRQIPRREDLEPGTSFRVEAVRLRSPDEATDMVRITDSAFSVPRSYVGRATDEGIAHFESPGFLLDETEVTIGQFRVYVADVGIDPSTFPLLALPDSLDDRPMALITFSQAQRYAEWAGKRLPGEREFIRAAASDVAVDPPHRLSHEHVEPEEFGDYALGLFSGEGTPESEFPDRVPAVGSHPRDRSFDGALDLLGSVSELLETPWIDPQGGSTRLATDFGRRVVAGAQWVWPRSLAAYPQVVGPILVTGERRAFTGFRCAKSLDPFAVSERRDDESIE